ncbi:MAG: electron transport complex subunit RsxE [Bacilli bacterium]
MTIKENFLKGIFKENPVFVFLLGMCPTLAVTAFVETALGMGILVILVLIGSNVVVSLMKNLIPDEIRIPAFIVIIAAFVTIIEMLTNAYAGALADSLGVFIPLIVVNCMILGRAESYASQNNVFNSFIDAIGMGVGFTLAIMILAFFRELLATGAISYGTYLPIPVSGSIRLFSETFGMTFFGVPAGAFVTLGMILAVIAAVRNNKVAKAEAIKAEKIRVAKEKAAKAKAEKEAEEAKKSDVKDTVESDKKVVEKSAKNSEDKSEIASKKNKGDK